MALIYVVEDDTNILEIEMMALRNSNYQVYGFSQASDLYKRMESILPDLILLDIMLPGESGNEIVRKLRADHKTAHIPVIMVTAKTAEIDLVKGLDDGADDYIRKPFSVMELLSRVKALLRRTGQNIPTQLTVGEITLDHDKHTVTIAGKPVELTFKEYELLRYMMLNENTVLSRETIMLSVWETDYEGETRTVDMHIKTLRQKLGEYGSYIGTVRNVGYVISEEK